MSGNKVFRLHVADPDRDLQTLECYRLNKIFMLMIGQWPFSPVWQQRLGIIVFFCSVGTVYSLELADLIKSRKDFDEIIDCVVPMSITTGSVVKLCTLIAGAKSVRHLFAQIQDDWNTITTEAEKRILQQYANNSKFLTKIYMVYVYCTLLAYVFMPMMPIIINYTQPLNESRLKKFPSRAEYFMDEPTDHYVALYVHQSLAAFFVSTAIISCDTACVLQVHHVCGTFASLTYKLENLTNGEEYDEDLCSPKENDRVFAKLIDCIKQHRKAIKLAECIENTYYISNLIQVIANMIIISVTGAHTVINIRDTEVVLRFGPVVVAELIHLFYNNLLGQALHDRSMSIFYAAYNCKWYLISKNSKVLVQIIMLRSLMPCQLTAGKFFIVDLERFCAVVQTSMSYFTLLKSLY